MKKITKIISIVCLLAICIGTLSGCGGDKVQIDKNAPEYRIANDKLIKPSQNDMFRYKVYDSYVAISEYLAEEIDVIIPDTIEEKPVLVLEEKLFSKNTNIATVIISNNVVQIGEAAFEKCTQLKQVTLSKNLTAIPTKMMEGCTSLEAIIIPDSVLSIGVNAFNKCTSLQQVTIPSTVELIKTRAFANCKNLKKAVFMDGVIADEEGNYIKTVHKTLEGSIFVDCDTLEEILIPESITTIGKLLISKDSDAVVYGYLPSAISTYCAENKINFIEAKEGDDKDRQMKDRSIIIPEGADQEDGKKKK